MKLSKTQEKVYNEIRKDVSEVQACETIEEYFNQVFLKSVYWKTFEECQKKDPILTKIIKRRFDFGKQNIATTYCDSRTLYALQKNGLIEIIRDGKGKQTTDVVRLLNKS